MQKKTFRIFFGNNADIQEIEKHLNRGNSERIADNNSNGTLCQRPFHRHRRRNRKPRINPIDAALRCVDTKTFNIIKPIPRLARQHILAWAVDKHDDSDMLLQLNCKTHHLGFHNMRLNCYLMKPSEEHPYGCVILDMRDLDSQVSVGVSTAFFPEEFYDGEDLLQYILVEVLGSAPLWDRTQYAAFLIGEISFYRTRTLSTSERNKVIL